MPTSDSAARSAHVGPRLFAAGTRASDASAATVEELDAFARANLGRAVRIAWRLVGGDHAAAEDVVQDALLAAHRSLAGFRGEAKLETWFFRILYRKALNYRRWRAIRPSFAGDVDAAVADARPGDGAADREIARRIGDALARLSAPQRGAFVLVHLEGFSSTEAAALMGKAHGTVKSHLHRALRSLREELADLDPGETRS